MPSSSSLRPFGNPNSTNRQPVKPGPPHQKPPAPDAAPMTAAVRSLYSDAGLFDPEEFISDDPVFITHDAAAMLGVPADRLMKWRQRGQGPEYLEYEDGGIRYELSALIAYKASRRIHPSRQPRQKRRP